MEIKDKVWLRNDLEDGMLFGETYWCHGMLRGVLVEVSELDKEHELFGIKEGEGWSYTFEMVDWDVTHKMLGK